MPASSKVPPPHFLVFVPGFMGSQLRDRQTGELVWLDLPAMLKKGLNLPKAIRGLFDKMTYPNPDLEPAGIIKDVLFLPPFLKQEQYGRFFEHLQSIGYQVDPDAAHANQKQAAYTFAYDWRQDNRISARQLGEAIAGWEKRHPGAKAWVIGHSNGGIVARWYIEKEGGKDHVGRLFLMASPWDGAPKSMQVMLAGVEIMFMRLFNFIVDIPALTRGLVATLPSFYQLIPHIDPFLRDNNNQVVDPLTQPGWATSAAQLALAKDAIQFDQELGSTLSVETLCFVGNRLPTATGGVVALDAGGKWQHIDWNETEAGDGTVPERSAANTNAREVLPYHVSHGDIYINPDVLEKLEWELVRKYRGGVLAAALIGKYRVEFNPVGDVFKPGESILVWARVINVKKNTLVTDLTVHARLAWRQPLPGQAQIAPPDLPETDLAFKPGPGAGFARFEGQLSAPAIQGYYAVEGQVLLPGGTKPALLQELILVEAEPPAAPPPPPEASLSKSIDDVQPEVSPGPSVTQKPKASLTDDATDWSNVAFGFEASPLETGAEPSAAQQIKPEVLEQLSDRHLENEALKLDLAYVLAFSIDNQVSPWSTALDTQLIFQAGDEDVDLKVLLSSRDFAIYTPETQTLRAPRQGRSMNKARFDIQPLKAGTGEIEAFFLKENNYIQGVKLTLNVDNGAAAPIKSVECSNRMPTGVLPVEKRDLTLVIRDGVGPASFILTLVGPVTADATLNLSLADLDKMITKLRKTLKDEIVSLVDQDGVLAYQEKVKIDPVTAQAALLRLAKAGYSMFFRLFFDDGADANASLIGSYLVGLSQKENLKIQIVSDRFMLPWGALYVAARAPQAQDVKAENFLGFKHIIEHVPKQTTLLVSDVRIQNHPLEISLNIDTSLDRDLNADWAAQQVAYWEKLKYSKPNTTVAALQAALASDEFSDKILYYFGHAKSEYIATDSSQWLQMAGVPLILDDLKEQAPAKMTPFKNAPLIFLNACTTAELSPIYYGGFMPYFIARGARGFIGTECEIPGVFAAEWARRFFNQFLTGKKTIGEVFLDLRREFLEQENNLLGLLYALYCDADTRVVPGMKIPEG